MPKISLTAARAIDLACPIGKDQEHWWDTTDKGLGLRVTASGARAYVFQAKLHGRTVRITIGSPSAWRLESQWGKNEGGNRVEVRRGAREEARRFQTLIDQGIDPRQEKIEKREKAEAAKVEARRKDLTLGNVWPEYLSDRRPHWGDRHFDTHVKFALAGGQPKVRGKGVTVAGPLHALMSVRLSDLTAEKITSWLNEEKAVRPTNAHQAFRIIRAFIGWTGDNEKYKGLIPANACTARTVREAVPKSKAKEGDSLQREQLGLWFTAVRQLSNPVISAYLQSLVLTGARRNELMGLRWEDVDFQWRSLTIRDKTASQGRIVGSRTIPLTPYVAALLTVLPRRNQWVFSSPSSADGKLAEPRIAHDRALTASGLPHISIHGLRRTFGTMAEWVEVPQGISAQIMGHAPSALAEKHYRRRPLDLLRQWHDKIEAGMLAEAGIGFTASSPLTLDAA